MKDKKLEKVYMYGRHALVEALLARPEVVKKVYLARENRDKEIRDLVEKHKIPKDELKPGQGGEIVGRDASHQGVVALIDPELLMHDFDTFLKNLDVSPATSLAILGEVQDPHNVGAIIRSAAAFGVSGVLIPEHNQAQVTGAVIKASAGMVFALPLVRIGNVNNAVRALKQKGFWIYGLSADGKNELPHERFDTPAAFVVGNEGSGIREKTLAACDIVLKIPIHKKTESLNAAVSAAVVLYEWSKHHLSSPNPSVPASETFA